MSDASFPQVISDVGEAGVTRMRDDPGLAAAVDQHAAAVRDIIAATDQEPTPAVLLDYLHGFADAALERGWWPTGDLDWETVRVIAVCFLSR
jgi:Family of unknown function (DUF6401)